MISRDLKLERTDEFLAGRLENIFEDMGVFFFLLFQGGWWTGNLGCEYQQLVNLTRAMRSD